MKQLWIALIVGLVLGLVALIIYGFQYWDYQNSSEEEKSHIKGVMTAIVSMSSLEKSGGLFVDRIVPEVLSSWSSDTYVSFVNPDRSSDKETSIIKMYLYNMSQIYGELTQYLGSKGEIQFRGDSIKNAVVFAEYDVNVVFEKKGETLFQVSLSKDPDQDQWYLEGFHGL